MNLHFAAKRHLAAALLIAVSAVGCAAESKRVSGPPNVQINGNVKYGTFAQENVADLSPSSGLKELFVSGENVFGYTETNAVYALSSGLEIRYIQQQIAPPDVILRRPVAFGEETIFPTAVALKVVNKSGQVVRTVQLPHPLTSDVRFDQRGLLLAGTSAPTGGRVSVIDPALNVRPVIGDTLIGAVFSAPVGYQGIVYAAADDGNVYAIGVDNKNAWPLDEMRFSTNRAVKADLVIDEYGLFVASSDTKLYALDRTTGRIKWRYMAEVPLLQTPLVTADRVFQVVDGKGLAAIDKIEGKLYREPIWFADGVTRVLSVDADYVYAVQGANKLVALGLKDGKVKFEASGNLTMFAAGPNGRIFAANESGALVSFVRRPYTGDNVASR